MADEPRPDAETNPPQAAADEPEPSTKGEPDKIAALESELAETKDRLLRTLAEMENLRRRSEREMADTRQYAVANFARDMLTVSDNLRRAIDALPNKPDETSDPALAALIEGVEVTERGLTQTLEKFGVRPIDALGEKFDPVHHQAMFEIEDPERPAGSVAQVVQAGYRIGERVLRPAMVGVAKGGPKQKPHAADETAEGDGDSGTESTAQPVDSSSS